MRSIRAIVFALTILCSKQVFGQVPSYLPSTGLIGFWPLDSNATNAVNPLLYNGVVVNAMPANNRFAEPGKALYLNGTNAFVTLPSTVMAQVTGAYTVSIWLFIDSTFVHRGVGYELIADRDESTWLYRFRIGYGYDNAPIHFRDSSYFDRIVASSVVPRLAGPNPTIDGWTHFAFTFEPTGNGTMRGYVNGQLIGTRSNAGSVAGARQINIGRAIWPGSGNAGGAYVKGIVDEVAVWNRLLMPSEIGLLYNSCNIVPTGNPDSVQQVAGGSVQLTITNPGIVNYQWQMDSAANNNWVSVTNSQHFLGSNAATLTISPVQSSFNGLRFRCQISDTVCITYSQPTVLTVNCFNISTPPNNQVKNPGDSAIFTIGSTQVTHQYQWQIFNAGSWANLADFGQFSGTQSARLVVRNLNNLNHNQQFRCLVSAFGCHDTSAVAALNILCSPRNLNGPNNAPVVEAQTAIFQIDSVAGATYIWQRNVGFGFQNLSNGGNVQGVNQPVLRISNVQWSDNLTGYRCIVQKDHCADTSGTALLQVVGGVSVREDELSIWKMYPNPAKNEVMLERTGSPLVSRLVVRNSLGQLMLKAEVAEQSFKLNTTGWSEGIYLVEWEGRSQRLLISR